MVAVFTRLGRVARAGRLTQGLHEAALGLVPYVGEAAVGAEQQEESVDELSGLLLPFS